MLKRKHIISLVAFTMCVLAATISVGRPGFGFVPSAFSQLTEPKDTIPPGGGGGDTTKKVDLKYPLED